MSADVSPAPIEAGSIKTELAAAGARIGRGEAELLLAHLLGRDRSWLFAWPERTLTERQSLDYRSLVERRAAGVPIAQLTGRRAFWTLDLEVNADTLIPRPETELLVEWALELGGQGAFRVLDLGTGTGAIALALASERPKWDIEAVDRSGAALAVARRNAARLGLERIRWRRSDWLSAIAAHRRFDLIVSNPPYIADGDPHLSDGDLRFEPRSALAAGDDGLDSLRDIAAQAPAYLEPGGWLLVEHGYEQADSVRTLFEAAGLQRINVRHDLAGLQRATGACVSTA